ncbi:hypothetical protein M0R45_035119 [Rubus argutus]|uniref:Uncharacterized protein n=1 Tax=Rubus argutus TaxID=59490 RepID=A0AAW1VWD6_RUBAR
MTSCIHSLLKATPSLASPDMLHQILPFVILYFKNKHAGNMKREDRTINRRKRGDDFDQIYVFILDEPKLGVKTMKSYVTRMNEENVIRAILVAQHNLTPFAKTSISEIELLVNIKEHVLVHEHLVLSNDENKTLLERYTTKETQLPRRYITYCYVI